MSILFQKVIGRWFNEWEQRLQMNVSKIVWSAKDQAKVIEAKEKKKHSMQMSSSYIAKSEYAQNHNKESSITIKNGEDNVEMTNSNGLQEKEGLGSFQMKKVDIGSKHQQTYRYNNSGGIGRDDGVNQIGDEDENDPSKSFTYRIPISVCALPCKVGEKKVMSTVRLSVDFFNPRVIPYFVQNCFTYYYCIQFGHFI